LIKPDFKSKKVVRAELYDAIYVGCPVTLYPALNSRKIKAEIYRDNLSDIPEDTAWTNGDTKFGWEGAGNGFDNGGAITKEDGAFKIVVPSHANNHMQISIPVPISGGVFEPGKQYEILFNAKSTVASKAIRFQTASTAADCPCYRNDINETMSTEYTEIKFQWTATTANDFSGDGDAKPQELIRFDRSTSGEGETYTYFIKDIRINEIEEDSQTYKRMAKRDAIPNATMSTDSGILGAEEIDDTDLGTGIHWTQVTSPDSGTDAWTYDASADTFILGASKTGKSINIDESNANTSILDDNRYQITVNATFVSAGNNAVLKIDLGNQNVEDVITITKTANVSAADYTYDFTVDEGETSGAMLELYGSTGASCTITINSISIKAKFDFDIYSIEQDRFGIVDNVYDKDTGAMKAIGAAGDLADVCYQGETTSVKESGATWSNAKEKMIALFNANGSHTLANTGDDASIPNSLGVLTETTSSSATQPICLFNGVEPLPMGFSYKDSYQVEATAGASIDRYRPVGLYLNGDGGLMCKNDDIAEGPIEGDYDAIQCNPYKWGFSQNAGSTGDTILVTVAGKTKWDFEGSTVASRKGYLIRQAKEAGPIWASTASSSPLPNSHGTIAEDLNGPGLYDIILFKGAPTGIINDIRRTIKINCIYGDELGNQSGHSNMVKGEPVSIFLDSSGNYRCVIDNIPNVATNDQGNVVGLDARKWGILADDVTVGNSVDVIVAGRAEVVDTETSAAWSQQSTTVTQISGTGVAISASGIDNTLNGLAIVEKASNVSLGAYGKIIIF